MEHSLQTFEAGRLDEASQSLEKKTKGGLDQLVYTLEDATVSHTEGKLAESNKGFSDAEALIRNQEQKAVISASQTAAQGASILLNEKTIPYGGEPFEKVLVNTYKALNYLLLGEFEDARVEVRRSFARQKENRERHAKELQEMEDQAQRKRIRSQEYYREISSRYGDQAAIGQRVANLYEDPFAYYLSALVYELNGEYNDSYVDLKRVQTLYPGIPCVENDLLRAAKRSGMRDELRRWERTLGRTVKEPQSTEGELVLIFECGMAPRKTEIKIPLFIPNVGVIAIAFPKYEVLPNRIDHAALFTQEGSLLGKSYTFTDLEAIAIKNLEDRMPILILKQVLRAAAKATVTKVVSDQNGQTSGAGLPCREIYRQRALPFRPEGMTLSFPLRRRAV
jgi:hypothetical protein